ncbi:MAG: primosomal protein N' [Patescibacteria group bacterium]|nr:primosomal protein N' [Patescibacteria group bacterium]
MNIIKVIPISRGIGKETLSYFTGAEIKIGDIVEAPLRNKKISALVVDIKDVANVKSEIKNADFVTRKANVVKIRNLLSPEFIEASYDTAKYFASNSGSILNSLISKIILENEEKESRLPIPTTTSKNLSEKYAMQGDDDERFASYRSHIRQQFAKKKSVFFCVPTIEDAKKSLKKLEKGIEDYTFVLHSKLKKKEIISLWKKIIEEKHPTLIISTPSFIAIPRNDIGTIIVEKENAKNYKTLIRPYFDIRYFMEKYAEKIGAQIIFGDILLRIETLWREEEGEILKATPFKFRSLFNSEETLVDMRKYKTKKGIFKIAGEEIEELIKNNKANSHRLFIFAVRRGIAPSALCADCQNIVMCDNCDSPVILHSSKTNNDAENYFSCHHCGKKRSADEVCKVCGSWKLATIGIGIELVEEKIKQRFPDIKIFRIDSDSIKTEKQLTKTIQSFYNSPGSILVGTEMALSYLNEKIENSAIISIDSLFSIPDFKIHEKILYTLLKIRNITSQTFIIQTRNPDEKVLEYALKGNLIDFYRKEIIDRKSFDYPPFSILIKITIEGEKNKIIKEMENVKNILLPFTIDIFQAFTKTVKNKSVLHSLIKIPRNKWPDSELLEKLYSLPQYVAIKVDPDNLL